MIPDELKQLRQWIKLPPGLKYPTDDDWQNNPQGWHDIKEPNGRGFLLKGTPYLCIDGDHVLNNGAYVTPWVEQFFNGLLQTGTYAEISFSGAGVHVFFKLEPQQDYPGYLNRLKGMNPNGGRYFNYYLPEFAHLPVTEQPHIEIFYNAGRQICFTGKSLAGDTIQPAPAMVNELLAKMLTFSVPPAPLVVRSDNTSQLPPSYDRERAVAMLDYINPANVTYGEWIAVGAVLHDLGADVTAWDMWSSKDTARYKGSREIYSKWASFRGTGQYKADIKTLHGMAKAGGYSEKDFMREWYKENQAMQVQAPAPTAQPFNPWAIGITELIETVDNNAYTPMSTGIKTLDDVIGGGLMRRKLYGIGAPPAMGKTGICQQISESTAEANPNCTVLYFCFEMPRAELQARSVARYGHAHGGQLGHLDILQGKLGWRETAEAYYKAVGHKVAYGGMAGGGNPTDLDTVDRAIRQATAYNASIGRPAPLVVVDYLQLLTIEGQQEQEVVKQAMVRLKNLAVELDTTIIVVFACNREANKGQEISMYVGRGSSSIEYAFDVELVLTYTELADGTKKEPKDINKKKRSLVITKARGFDPEGQVDFDFDGKYMEFNPLDNYGRPASDKENTVINQLLSLAPQGNNR